MKKNFKLLITSLLLFFLQLSCEKDKNYVETASIQLDSGVIIEKAKEHFITSTSNLRTNDERMYSPKWEFSEVVAKQNGNNLVLTPLYGNKMVSYTNKPGYFRRLVTELDKKNTVKKTDIIELFGEIDFIKSNYKILLEDTNSKRLKEFKGGILITDYYSKTENGKKYDLEKIIGKLNLKIKSKNKNARAYSEDCWGMYLTTTYEDGSQTEELLYWWCNNSGNYEPNDEDQQGPDHGSSGGDADEDYDFGATCKAGENLSEICQDFISRCRKGSIRGEFPEQFLEVTISTVKNGSSAEHKKAWKLLNDGRFDKNK